MNPAIKKHRPFVPENVQMKEFTLRAVLLGLVMTIVLGAANAYLGLHAGQTIAATYPAAVIGMAVLRMMKGSLLEENFARTVGSIGESVAAGAIFTIPAFLMVEINGVRLWSDLRAHYWAASLILLAGGLIGIFFIVLLRRALCVEAGLPFPESVASYEIVRAGQDSGDAPRYIFGAMAFGGLIQILKDPRGLPSPSQAPIRPAAPGQGSAR